MAVGVEEEDCTRRRRPKRHRGRRKLLLDEKVEVRSLEDGFLGSWHPGTVIECDKRGRRCVRYDHLLQDDELENLVGFVNVSPTIEGSGHATSRCSSYRGCIRPLPPPTEVGKWRLPYGQCVDVYHNDAWWEGVIFDLEDGSEERKIFFPDLGDELVTRIDSLRITQDWDELTEAWQYRGRWLFLELIEEFEQDCCLTVSIKQIWYDVREKNGFEKIREWTSSARAYWKELVSEAINDNLRITIDQIFQELISLGSFEQENRLSLEFAQHDIDVNMYPQADTGMAYSVVPFVDSSSCGKSLLTLPSSSDDVTRTASTIKTNRSSSTSSDKTCQEHKSSTRKRVGIWLPAGPDIAPGAEFCPDAITKYGSPGNKYHRNTLVTYVRKHLLYLGWSIELYRDGKGIQRLRYTSPNGTSYFSLRQVCLQLMESTTETPSSSAQDSQKSLCASPNEVLSLHLDQSLVIENPDYCRPSLISSHSDILLKPEPCPEAVVKWYETEPDESRRRHSMYKDLILKAKKHLCYLGWEIKHLKKGKRELVAYKSPNGGRVYFSLRKACEHCIHGGGVSENSGSTCGPMDNFQNLVSATDQFQESSFVSQSKITELSRGKLRGVSKLRRKRQDKKSGHASHSVETKAYFNAQKRFLPRLKDGKTSRVLSKLKDNMKRSHPTRVLQSTIRVQQVLAPSYSHRNPRTVLSWLMENNVILPREKVYYCSRKDNSRLAEGMITHDGIKCSCCGEIYTVSDFEAHAGSTYHRPSAHIFLEDGRSLLDCQKQIRNKMRNLKAASHDRVDGSWHKGENDNICSICHYGGELLLCDQCPSSFHKDCLGLKDIPDGDWFCRSCCCQICGGSTFKEDGAHTVNDSVLSCYQCEHKYHVRCLKNRKSPQLENCSKVNWFCSKRCEEICRGLQELLGKPVPVGVNNLTWTLMKSFQSDDPELDASNSEALTESYSKLHVALCLMHECFEHVTEPCTGRDLVKDIIFNRWSRLNRLNFRGFYTVLLERNDELITVATVRVYGEKVAEVPLVATRFHYRQQGMCRILMNELEKKLMELGVEKLVLPAVPSVIDTWTNSFGFSQMTVSERLKFVDYTFLEFQGTIMCQKFLSKIPSGEPNLSKGTQFCGDGGRRGHRIDFDGSSFVSEVYQVEQFKESPTVDHGVVETATGIDSFSSQGLNPRVLMENAPIDLECEQCIGEITPGCSVENVNCTKERFSSYNRCYKRRKISVSCS